MSSALPGRPSFGLHRLSSRSRRASGLSGARWTARPCVRLEAASGGGGGGGGKAHGGGGGGGRGNSGGSGGEGGGEGGRLPPQPTFLPAKVRITARQNQPCLCLQLQAGPSCWADFLRPSPHPRCHTPR